jgi:hypothetical protein
VLLVLPDAGVPSCSVRLSAPAQNSRVATRDPRGDQGVRSTDLTSTTPTQRSTTG